MDRGRSLKTKSPEATGPQVSSALSCHLLIPESGWHRLCFSVSNLPSAPAVASHWADPAPAQDPGDSPTPAPMGVWQALLVGLDLTATSYM